MALQGSQKIPRDRLAYFREAGQHMKLVLTGSAIAALLTGGSIVGLLTGPIELPMPRGAAVIFTPSVWMISTVWLALFAIVQYKMWASLRDQLHAVTEALYRHHPIVDDGIDLQQVHLQSPTTGPGRGGNPYRRIAAVLTERRADELLVTCDGDSDVSYAIMHWLLPEERRGPQDSRAGLAGAGRAQSRATMVAPNSFRVTAPEQSYPVEVTLQIHGYPAPVVVCMEWLE